MKTEFAKTSSFPMFLLSFIPSALSIKGYTQYVSKNIKTLGKAQKKREV
jgi:hypothetical protein